MSDHDDSPELSFSLDLRGLRTWLDFEGGQPILHLSDGNEHIALESIAGDSAADGIENARNLAKAVSALAAALDLGRPVDWWTPLPGFVPDRQGHSVSGF